MPCTASRHAGVRGDGPPRLATPFFAAETTVNRMKLDPEYRGRIDLGYYPAGHMMYVHQPSLEQLKADLDAFYDSLP